MNDLRFQIVKRRLGVHKPRANHDRHTQDHGSMITDTELGRQSGHVLSEKAVCHCSVEQHGHDAAMETIGISLEGGTAVELGDDASVGLLLEMQSQAVRPVAAAHQT